MWKNKQLKKQNQTNNTRNQTRNKNTVLNNFLDQAQNVINFKSQQNRFQHNPSQLDHSSSLLEYMVGQRIHKPYQLKNLKILRGKIHSKTIFSA